MVRRVISRGYQLDGTDTQRADKNKKTIVEEGAVPIFVNLLKSNDVKLQNEAVKLQNEAVGALRNLSLDGSIESPGLRLLIADVGL
jgi:hypothetical protein